MIGDVASSLPAAAAAMLDAPSVAPPPSYDSVVQADRAAAAQAFAVVGAPIPGSTAVGMTSDPAADEWTMVPPMFPAPPIYQELNSQARSAFTREEYELFAGASGVSSFYRVDCRDWATYRPPLNRRR